MASLLVQILTLKNYQRICLLITTGALAVSYEAIEIIMVLYSLYSFKDWFLWSYDSMIY